MKRPNQRLWLRAAVTLLASGLALSACGSDESEDANDDDSTAGAAGTGGSPRGPDAGSSAAGGAGGAPAPPPPECQLDQTWLDCTVDSDCGLLRQRTCVACFWLSVNVANEQDVVDCYGDLTNCVERRSAPCSAEPQGATCVNGRCDFTVDCSTTALNLCGETGKCSVVQGKPCQPVDGGSSSFVQVGCFPKKDTPTAGRTCAEDPVTGQQLVFLSDETPPGWTTCDVSACAP